MNIITIVKDDPEALKNTYDSILNAVSYGLDISNWIIKLSCDTDNSLALITHLPSYAFVNTSNDKGIYDAINIAALNLSTVDLNDNFTLLLNAGDKLIPTAARFINSIINSGIDNDCLIFSAVTDSGREIVPIPYAIGVGGLNFCHQSIFFKLKLLIEYPFPTKYKIAGDYAQFISLGARKHFIVNFPIVVYSLDGVSEKSRFNTRLDNFKAGFDVYRSYECFRLLKMYFCRFIYRLLS